MDYIKEYEKISSKCKYKWSINDEVICISNVCKELDLILGETYKVINTDSIDDIDMLLIIDSQGNRTNALASRFTTLKIMRKEKLKNLEKSNEK